MDVGVWRENRGQTAVEFALILPVLLLVVFGIIDFGITFNNVIGMRQGVSASGREAAVGQFGSNSSCTLTGATGLTPSQKDLLCEAHSLDGINNDSSTRVAIVVGNTTSSSYTVGSQVTVCEEYQINSVTGYLPFLNTDVATSEVTDEVQTVNSSGLTSAQETPLTGSSWSFCSTPAAA